MHKHEADKLIETIRGFVTEDVIPPAGRNGKELPTQGPIEKRDGGAQVRVVPEPGHQFDNRKDVPGPDRGLNADQKEKLYQEFKSRFITEAKIDPVLLQLIMVQPEIVIEVERQVIRLDGSTLRGRVARLIAQGWFDEPRATSATRRELARTGSDPSGNNNLANALGMFKLDWFLVLEGDAWRKAHGVKVTEQEIVK